MPKQSKRFRALAGQVKAKTTVPLAKRMLRDPNFVAGNVHTKYVEQTMLVK